MGVALQGKAEDLCKDKSREQDQKLWAVIESSRTMELARQLQVGFLWAYATHAALTLSKAWRSALKDGCNVDKECLFPPQFLTTAFDHVSEPMPALPNPS